MAASQSTSPSSTSELPSFFPSLSGSEDAVSEMASPLSVAHPVSQKIRNTSTSDSSDSQAGTEAQSADPAGIEKVDDLDDLDLTPLDRMKEIWKMFNIRDPQILDSAEVKPKIKTRA